MRTRWLPVLGLAVLTPVCAEYLAAYDESTGDVLVLLGSLVIFVPLYGCPALLIREVARRRELGWPGILLLGAAFGLVEAGLVDQSMFSENYRDISYWDEISAPTYVEPIGLSIFLAVTFVGGHAVNTIGAPIALVEGIAGRRGQEPWLGRPMVVVATVLYLAASGLLLGDHLATQDDHASVRQLVGTALVVVLLVVAALRVGHRPPSVRSGPVPAPWLVGVGGFVAMAATQALPPSKLGTTALVALNVLVFTAAWLLARRPAWSTAHIASLAGGVLIAAGTLAFRGDPLGDVSDAAHYTHSALMLLLVVALTVLAVRRSRTGGVHEAGVSA
jgi:hypothetical protein